MIVTVTYFSNVIILLCKEEKGKLVLLSMLTWTSSSVLDSNLNLPISSSALPEQKRHRKKVSV